MAVYLFKSMIPAIFWSRRIDNIFSCFQISVSQDSFHRYLIRPVANQHITKIPKQDGAEFPPYSVIFSRSRAHLTSLSYWLLITILTGCLREPLAPSKRRRIGYGTLLKLLVLNSTEGRIQRIHYDEYKLYRPIEGYSGDRNVM